MSEQPNSDNIQNPEDSQQWLIDRLDTISKYSEALAEDLPNFIELKSGVESKENGQLDSEVPEGYQFRSNVGSDTFSRDNIYYKLLKQMGDELVIISKDDEHNSVYISPNSKAVDIVSAAINEQKYKHKILSNIEISVGSIPWTFYLDENNSVSLLKAENDDPDPSVKGLAERAFMLGVLNYTAIKMANGESIFDLASDKPAPFLEQLISSLKMYQKLKDNGVEPLGFEEVNGLASAVILDILHNHPELDFRSTRAHPHELPLEPEYPTLN